MSSGMRDSYAGRMFGDQKGNAQGGAEDGASLIAAERRRQIEDEGWSPEHDDQHTDGSLALVAACYATPVRLYEMRAYAKGPAFRDPWPDSWGLSWDKRAEYGERRDNPGNTPPDPSTYTHTERLDLLVKAGALIAAEIDRLQRAARRGEADDDA